MYLLFSRACRLKKKAQHEAYKIKLHGLDMEHKQLLQLTQDMKQKFTQVLQKTLPERKIVKQEGTDELQMTQYLEKTAEKAYSKFIIHLCYLFEIDVIITCIKIQF